MEARDQRLAVIRREWTRKNLQWLLTSKESNPRMPWHIPELARFLASPGRAGKSVPIAEVAEHLGFDIQPDGGSNQVAWQLARLTIAAHENRIALAMPKEAWPFLGEGRTPQRYLMPVEVAELVNQLAMESDDEGLYELAGYMRLLGLSSETEDGSREPEGEAGGRGQGRGLTPAERRCVERYALERAEVDLRDAGWENVKFIDKPYDFRCTTGRRELHVEVKGTTEDGSSVILTAGEVDHTKHCLKVGRDVDLYIVHDIQLCCDETGSPIASGGERNWVQNSRIQDEQLAPTQYKYTL